MHSRRAARRTNEADRGRESWSSERGLGSVESLSCGRGDDVLLNAEGDGVDLATSSRAMSAAVSSSMAGSPGRVTPVLALFPRGQGRMGGGWEGGAA